MLENSVQKLPDTLITLFSFLKRKYLFAIIAKLKTFITKVDTSSIADRFTLIVIRLFIAQNTSRNNTHSGFNKERTEKEDENLEHRDRSSISPPIFLWSGFSRPGRRGSR